jgi:hypothetical protein
MNYADELVKVYRLENVDIGDGSAGGRQAHYLRRGGSRDGADLTNARVNEEQLREAESLEGATKSDGRKYEVWLKSKGSTEDGEVAGAS